MARTLGLTPFSDAQPPLTGAELTLRVKRLEREVKRLNSLEAAVKQLGVLREAS